MNTGLVLFVSLADPICCGPYSETVLVVAGSAEILKHSPLLWLGANLTHLSRGQRLSTWQKQDAATGSYMNDWIGSMVDHSSDGPTSREKS